MAKKLTLQVVKKLFDKCKQNYFGHRVKSFLEKTKETGKLYAPWM